MFKMTTIVKKYLKYALVIISLISIVFIVYTVSTTEKKVEQPSTTALGKFSLSAVSPAAGKVAVPIPNLSIEFTFSKAINISSLSIVTDPNTDIGFNSGEDKKSIFVYPKENWNYDTEYSITVNVQSTNGELLENPVVYKFTPIKIRNSALDESGLGR